MSSTMKNFGLTVQEIPTAKPGRQAKKLCAPCNWVVRENPTRYCDEVSVAGQAYCAAHQRALAAGEKRSKMFGFTLVKKTVAWRSRGFA